MSHSKIYFFILNLALIIASNAVASDPDDARYRHLPPLSTNLKLEDFEDSDEAEFNSEDFIYKERDSERHKKDFEFFLREPKAAMDQVRKSKRKMQEIEREVRKRSLEGERELKKLLAEIDRERRKHIVEIEREQRKLLQEIEREYRKNIKEREKD